MERIAIDTIGPLPNDMGFKYIIVIIDTFTCYVDLFSKQEVMAIYAADVMSYVSIHAFRYGNGFWFTIYEPITNVF